MLYSRFSLVIYFMRSVQSVQMSVPSSQFLPPPSPAGIHTFVFYACVLFCFTNVFICTVFLVFSLSFLNYENMLIHLQET